MSRPLPTKAITAAACAAGVALCALWLAHLDEQWAALAMIVVSGVGIAGTIAGAARRDRGAILFASCCGAAVTAAIWLAGPEHADPLHLDIPADVIQIPDRH